jgi:RimJ/RimL family protein N-acetyltransferase
VLASMIRVSSRWLTLHDATPWRERSVSGHTVLCTRSPQRSSIANVVAEDGRASMAVGIDDPDLLGRGVGTEAIELLPRQAFEEMQLHRLSLRVLEYNTRAIRA